MKLVALYNHPPAAVAGGSSASSAPSVVVRASPSSESQPGSAAEESTPKPLSLSTVGGLSWLLENLILFLVTLASF